jgi:hypothetical protein
VWQLGRESMTAEKGRRPARERLVEVIGEWPSRAKAKRRKASPSGESATGDETQYPQAMEAQTCSGHGCTGDEMVTQSVALTHGELPGPP